MFEYKDEIRATRKGCLGSSDGKMLEQIVNLGYVPRSAYKRLAVVKGLIPQEEIPETAAIRMGNETEMQIFEHLKAMDDRWQSNVRWESKDFSTPNCKLISHPDFVLQDDDHKTLFVCECKTTKNTIEQTRAEYGAQLFIHYVLARELAINLGDDWNVKLSLCHYSTEGLDLNEHNEFDPNRLTIREVRPSTSFFDVHKAMGLVDAFLQDFNEYYEGDEIPYELLPADVKEKFLTITNVLAEIKEREKKVEDFKKKLTEFMISKGIKGIKTDAWAITLVNESESVSVDYKAIFANEIEAKKPRIANKLKKQYKKVTKKKAYVMIKTKDNNE